MAYAASVKNRGSNLSAIESLGKKIGEITVKEPAIKVVHAPLLGTGAGRLDPIDVIFHLKKGFLKTSDSNAILIIHCINMDIYNRIIEYYETDKRPISAPKDRDSIRVFISWTLTNNNHKKWLENLAAFLRENGVNIRLDLWHLRRGMDLPQFMSNELSLAKKVLIISNEQYTEKADGRMGGVGWETMIIQGDMSKQKPDSTKYLVIAKCENIETGVPQYLKTKYLFHWSNNSSENTNRQQLLNELLDRFDEPPLGVMPIYI